jgi:hypothetical protein
MGYVLTAVAIAAALFFYFKAMSLEREVRERDAALRRFEGRFCRFLNHVNQERRNLGRKPYEASEVLYERRRRPGLENLERSNR